MAHPLKPWHWLAAGAFLIATLGLLWRWAFAQPAQPLSQKVQAGPTPVADEGR